MVKVEGSLVELGYLVIAKGTWGILEMLEQ